MDSLASKEGTVKFHIDSISTTCETWYKIVGDLDAPDTIPLFALHGGPGACHEYLLPLQKLAEPTRPMIFYDQIGNGRSTHLRHLRGDERFWTMDLFMAELSNLVCQLGLGSRTFDLHGQSWGGMLGAEYAIRGAHRQQIRKLILSNSLASTALYVEGTNIEIQKFPEKFQEAIAKARQTGEYETADCMAALDHFMRHLLSVSRPWPNPALAPGFEWLKKDDTTYFTIYGPSMLSPTGAIRTWSIIDDLHKITAQTLVLIGEYEGAQRIAAQPFVDNIREVEYVVVEGAAHMSHLDQPEQYFQIMQTFLKKP